LKTVGIIFAGLAAVVALTLLGLGTSWFGLVTARPMAVYSKETERRVYVTSVAHQQGADSGVGIACANMRNASSPLADRHGYAGIVLSTAASYAGTAALSSDSQDCVAEAKTLLAIPLPN
jgi:hypothetical protein